MRIINQILIIISICFVVGLIGISYSMLNSETTNEPEPYFYIQFEKDAEKNTLSVSDINFNTDWSLISKNGNAVLPYGSIDKGDVITNCFGNVELYYSNTYIGSWNFVNKYDDAYFDAQFNGRWKSGVEEYELDFDNRYNCIAPTPINPDQTILCKNIGIEGKFNYTKTKQNIYFDIDEIDDINYSWDSYTDKSRASFGYYFTNQNDMLYLYNSTLNSEIVLKRSIDNIKNSKDLSNYLGEKVNITGFFNANETDNYGYLNYNTSEEEIIVSFEYYDENNASFYDNKTIEIIGFIYPTSEDEIWDKPFIKYIESIRVID